MMRAGTSRWVALAAAAAFFLPSVAPGQPDTADPRAPNPHVSDLVRSFVYGVYCAEDPIDLAEAPETSAGVVNIVPGLPDMLAETTFVPAQVGIGFGVLVAAAPDVILDPTVITITHPPYADTGVEIERWITAIDGEGPGLIGFSFDVDTELVTGAWVFEAEHAGETLFRIAFEVVPAAAVPALARGCAGAFLS